MRFLADENVPRALVDQLSAFGHDVVSVRSMRPGVSDPEIIEWAVRDSRIVLTFDKDFGELAWQGEHSAPFGIILFRLPLSGPKQGVALAGRVNERNDWPGHFSVVEADRIRMRPLAK